MTGCRDGSARSCSTKECRREGCYEVKNVKPRCRRMKTWKEVDRSALEQLNLSTSDALDRKKWKNDGLLKRLDKITDLLTCTNSLFHFIVVCMCMLSHCT